MNASEAIAWNTVTRFLDGHLDHADAHTRRAIAEDLAFLDAAAAVETYMAPRTADGWDLVLHRVETREA